MRHVIHSGKWGFREGKGFGVIDDVGGKYGWKQSILPVIGINPSQHILTKSIGDCPSTLLYDGPDYSSFMKARKGWRHWLSDFHEESYLPEGRFQIREGEKRKYVVTEGEDTSSRGLVFIALWGVLVRKLTTATLVAQDTSSGVIFGPTWNQYIFLMDVGQEIVVQTRVGTKIFTWTGTELQKVAEAA